MQQLINGYVESCALVRTRIGELTQLRNKLKKQGREDTIGELDLERRIRLLYVENSQMEEIIEHLESCVRRTVQRGKT